MCLGAIYWARPARAFYSALASDAAAAGCDDAFIYQEIARPHAERGIPFLPLMREEALECFRAWGDKADRVPY